ncbi:MAG TPA: SHOCT domain-containing protein [Solirubrobacteraceae bacterium]
MTASPTGASPEPGEAKQFPQAFRPIGVIRVLRRASVIGFVFGPAEQLQRLAALTGQGILTKEEFAAQKAKILAS